MLTRRVFLAHASAAAMAPLARAQFKLKISEIDIVHHTHTDIGYTDLPSVVRDKQIRYLNSAMELCKTQPSFRWTVESLVGMNDWWLASSTARRDEFLKLVAAGRMDVMGLPFNQTPFLNARQWKQMMAWIPADLWRKVSPRAAMQNDVNGFPRAGAFHLLDRGINHLMMGINADSGGPPFYRPSAFWWRMPDGRKLFVWLGEHYGRAMDYLSVTGPGSLKTDLKSLGETHATCLKKLAKLEGDGYGYTRLLLTFTHPMAYDNGPPFAPLAPFVDAWNAARLQPSLRLLTSTQAVKEMEQLVGASCPTLEGEWTDWWANGSASGPRELAASRVAKRDLEAALSPVWGPLPASAAPAVESVLRDLCLFDEHTWGAANSIGAPYSYDTIAQYNEKSELAYRPMGHAHWLLLRRAQTRLAPMGEGTFVANPTSLPISGWAAIPRGPRRWVEELAPHTVTKMPEESAPPTEKPEVAVDATGWPLEAKWTGMARPLFEGIAGHFVAAQMIPPANRRTITTLHANPDAAARDALRKKSLQMTDASYGSVRYNEGPHTLLYAQDIRHERIAQATRTLELWKRRPRARLTLKFDRIASVAPEVLYAAFALPKGLPLPVFASGGIPFTPYTDQLKGSCRDYYGIDGWAHYKTADGEWLWVTRDAPLVAPGGPHALERRQEAPEEPHRIAAMLFDNCWHTNFVADSHGTMQFQFELAWQPKIADPAALAESLMADPLVFVNGNTKEHPALLDQLYRP